MLYTLCSDTLYSMLYTFYVLQTIPYSLSCTIHFYYTCVRKYNIMLPVMPATSC